jgi:hypothetical protein
MLHVGVVGEHQSTVTLALRPDSQVKKALIPSENGVGKSHSHASEELREVDMSETHEPK